MPREAGECGGIGVQNEVGAHLAAEAGNGGGVERNAEGKRPLQLVGKDGEIFLPPEHIAKREADELYILLSDVLDYFRCRVSHSRTLQKCKNTGKEYNEIPKAVNKKIDKPAYAAYTLFC